MKYYTTPDFWEHFQKLPKHVQKLARKNFELLKENPGHASLRFKRIKNLYSVRIGLRFRALGVDSQDGIIWFWVGSHDEYDKLIS